MQRLAFDLADQERFAALSGDRNPLHLDPVAARRLLTGRPVVHGVHTLLRMLNGWPDHSLPLCWRIEAEFLNPLSVGELADLTFDFNDDGDARAVASVAGLPCCRVTWRPAHGDDASALAVDEAEMIVLGAQPLDRDPDEWVGQHQRILLPVNRFKADFGAACARLGERHVAAIALLSSYVGMVCPGLHSVFSALVVEAGDAGCDSLVFHVRRCHPRLRLVEVAFEGALRGKLKAFVRAPAQVQAGLAELRALVTPQEFTGGTHWVIGGSRGLGEVVAKLLAAGGGRVCLSYATGAADADRVVQEMAASGAPDAAARRLDLLQESFDNWLRDAPWPDAVWYFATPRIFRKRAMAFDAGVFDEFLHFYVRRFEELCRTLEAGADGRRVRVFYPSSVFIDERPRGMTEYTMAKAAAEILIADLSRSLRQVTPVAHRLPRLSTDQTVGLFTGGAGSNAEALLPVIRDLLSRR